VSTIDGTYLSWIATRSLPSIVLDGQGSPAVSRQGAYLAAYANAAAATWQRPWDDEKSHSHYWEGSFGPAYRSVSGDKAWKRQVPLRDASPPALTTALAGVRLVCDRLLFPCGTAVLVRAEIAGAYNAAGLLSVVAKLADDPVVVVPGAVTPKAMRAVVGDLLDSLEVDVLGHVDPGAVADMRSTTVATVTATTGWPGDPVVQADPVHRLLEGLCRTSAAPLTGAVGDLAAARVDAANAFPETTRVAVGRGNAVWSPGGSDKLDCYHHNLEMALAHTGVLLDAVRLASGQAPGALSEDAKALYRLVVNVLGLMYSGAKLKDVYRSNLVRRQIDQSGLVADISRMRIDLGVGVALK
jgi:hypothetical protein